MGKEETGPWKNWLSFHELPNTETLVSQIDQICRTRKPSSVAWQTRLQAGSFTNKIS